MYFSRKLKPQQFGIEFLVVLLVIPVLAVVFLFWGERAAWGVIAGIYFLVVTMHMNTFFRTGNTSFLIISLSFLMVVVLALYGSINGMSKHDPQVKLLLVLTLVSLIIIGYVLFTKRIKWRTREMLELAAMPVNDAENGFTRRPLSAGKIDAADSAIESFSVFLLKNLIAMPYKEDGKVIFSLSSSYLKQNCLKRGYDNESWVSFSDKGEVNVFISKNDYLRYKESLSFDQLCSNLGRLFIEFFEIYEKGEGTRIIDRLNALNLNPITE